MKYNRIIIKISGESLQSENDIYDFKVIDQLKEQIETLISKGVQVAIVIGGGNIYRGIQTKNFKEETGHYMGMLSTSMNALMLESYLNENGLKSKVFNAFKINGIMNDINHDKIEESFDKGEVVIFGGGTGQPFVSTDTGAAWRAADIKAEAILIGKNGVDGAYDSDPAINKDAKFLNDVTYNQLIENKLKVIDIEASKFLKDKNIDVILFNINKQNNIINLWEGKIDRKTIIKK